MRRLLILATIAIGCLVGMAAMSSQASAYSSCTNTVRFSFQGGTYGLVLCSTNVHVWAQECSQMLMPGGWVPTNSQYACQSGASNIGYVEFATGPNTPNPPCGRWYRGMLTENVGYSGNATQVTAGQKFC